MRNEKNNVIRVVAQAFYGNKVETVIEKENVDRFILGYLDDSIPVTEKIDRTIVEIPNLDGIVIVYNKHFEEYVRNKEHLHESRRDVELKPVAVISELDMEIYSRCIVCRVDENGELASINDCDYNKFEKYLAK